MSAKIDLTGMRFGRLTVLSQVGKTKRGSVWLCQCDCGKTKKVNGAELRSGDTQSCGCLHKDAVTLWASHLNRKHGESRLPLYSCWRNMVKRCTDSHNRQFPNYGGRGITVCDEWRNSYEEFRDWALQNGYSPNLQIDRIDNDMGYSPINCRFVNKVTNANNKSNNRVETYSGVTDTLANLCRAFGANYRNVSSRLRLGYSIEEAFERPYRKQEIKDLSVNGVTRPIGEWCREYGIPANVVRERIRRGWTPEKALITPKRNHKKKENQ